MHQPIIIIVNSDHEAKRISCELVETRKKECGYTDRPPKKECRTCRYSGRYQSYGYQTHYYCDMHGFNVAARGKCNNFERETI